MNNPISNFYNAMNRVIVLINCNYIYELFTWYKWYDEWNVEKNNACMEII